MKWSDLKNEIRDLGFEDEAIFTEYTDLIINSTNRALGLINSFVESDEAKYSITQDGTGAYSYKKYVYDALTKKYTLTDISGTDTGLIRYNLEDLSIDSSGNITFQKFKRATLEVDDTIIEFNDFYIEEEHTFVIDSDIEGIINVYYEQVIQDITTSTPETFYIPVPEKVKRMVALLAAHYVWLDDDERKALTYYNEFDNFRDLYTQAKKDEKPRATIIGGVTW